MAGGKFTQGVDKIRPGVYMNFVTKAQATITLSERGTVLIPLQLHWGAPEEFVSIITESDVYEKLGYNASDKEMLPIREAKKRASEVLVYRLNGSTGVKATATWGEITATAKYAGTRGNELSIVAAVNVQDENVIDVKVLLGNDVVDEQSITKVSDLKNNNYVVFTYGESANISKPTETAKVTFSGGTDGEVTNEKYIKFLEDCEVQEFDVIAFPTTDSSLQTTFISYIKRMCDDEGKKIQGVIAGYTGSVDYEGIIDVLNGVVLADGTQLTAQEAIYWVAGATAGANVNESNTYSVYEGAVDAYPRLKNTEIVNGIKNGKFLFFYDGGQVKVETDINSLVTYPSGLKKKSMSKNRVIRVLNAINNDLKSLCSVSYIGKLTNNADGRATVLEAVGLYLDTLQNANAIQNFNSAEDISINEEKSVDDKVFVDIAVQPLDSMEKFYITTEVV